MKKEQLSNFTLQKVNSNRHKPRGMGLLDNSMAKDGWIGAITVSNDDQTFDGSARLETAYGRFGEDVEPIIVDADGTRPIIVRRTDIPNADDPRAKRLSVAANRVAEVNLDYDLEVLAGIHEEVGLEEMFFADEIAALMEKEENEIPHETKEENEEQLNETLDNVGKVESRVKLGEIWALGRHKILAGDSTVESNVRALLGDVTIDCMVTDPPYGVDYSSKNEFLNKFDKGNRNQTPIQNDAIEDYELFFSQFLKPIPFSDYNTCYIFMSDHVMHKLRIAFEKSKFTAACPPHLVWLKNNHLLGRSDYSAKHELILYGWKGKHKFYGDFSTTVLEFDKPQSSKEHPTMKPIELIERLYKDGSASDAIIYEPFLGSGTAILAAQKMEGNRTVYGCELSLDYMEVIIKRFEYFTGETAKLVGSI
jgi:site-specific DNA-methyltransferase (adenine-specific)